MSKTTLAKRVSIAAALAALAAAVILTANAVAGRPTEATTNIRPICENRIFTSPESESR
jgi:hypothetical protein